jgi:hypothetical protein
MPETTKNISDNRLGKTLSLAEKQESIQKLIGGVLDIFSKLPTAFLSNFVLNRAKT